MIQDDDKSASDNDASRHEKQHNEVEQESPTKVQDLAKAGRKDFDPNEGSD